VGEKAGIGFRMAFLPGEQGENFKINLYDHGCGVSVGDFDGDGRDDLYFVNQLGPNALYRNRGDGTFEDATAKAGVGLGDRMCTSASFADVDGDGDQDLFVASTRGGNVLFRNDGKGRFEDVTAAAGLSLVAHTQGMTFFDYDSDGDLDLYITNTAKWTQEQKDPEGRYWIGAENLLKLVQSEPEKNVLYRNEGDGTFKDVTRETGVAGTGWGGDVAAFDADQDGDQDLFVTNMFGISFLFRNDAGRRFTDVTDEALGRTSWGAVGCKPLDFDNDGLLDLYVVDMHSDMWMPADMVPASMEEDRRFGGPEGPMVERGLMTRQQGDSYRDLVFLDTERIRKVVFGNTLYRNLGGGKFEEVSQAAGAETLWPWGVAAADFDLDGREDAFLPAGMGYPYFHWPNTLLMNRGNGTYAKRAAEEGLEPRPGGPHLEMKFKGLPGIKSSRSAAVLDFDADGRPDLAVSNFNERAYLYRNRFPERKWVGLRLKGTRSNRDAIGALARLEAGGGVQVRQVQGAGGYLAQSTRTLHFGLGDAAKADRVTITWPSGTKQVLEGLEAGRVHEIVEPAEGAKK
jgi:hypothetical protein